MRDVETTRHHPLVKLKALLLVLSIADKATTDSIRQQQQRSLQYYANSTAHTFSFERLDAEAWILFLNI